MAALGCCRCRARGQHVFLITSWCFFNTQLPAGSAAALQPGPKVLLWIPQRWGAAFCSHHAALRAQAPTTSVWGTRAGWGTSPFGWRELPA